MSIIKQKLVLSILRQVHEDTSQSAALFVVENIKVNQGPLLQYHRSPNYPPEVHLSMLQYWCPGGVPYLLTRLINTNLSPVQKHIFQPSKPIKPTLHARWWWWKPVWSLTRPTHQQATFTGQDSLLHSMTLGPAACIYCGQDSSCFVIDKLSRYNIWNTRLII